MAIKSHLNALTDPHWLNGPEGSTSIWGTLPHGVYGATPAGPCASSKQKTRSAPAKPRTRKRRQYKAVSLGELQAALGGLPGSETFQIPTLQPGSKAQAKRIRAPKKRAKTLDARQLERVIDHIEERSRCPESDLVKLLLSHKAGLRAGEIAAFSFSNNCTDVEGRLAKKLFIGSGISKSRNDREIPMNDRLKAALQRLRKRYPRATHAAFSIGRDGQLRRQNAAAVTN